MKLKYLIALAVVALLFGTVSFYAYSSEKWHFTPVDLSDEHDDLATGLDSDWTWLQEKVAIGDPPNSINLCETSLYLLVYLRDVRGYPANGDDVYHGLECRGPLWVFAVTPDGSRSLALYSVEHKE